MLRKLKLKKFHLEQLKKGTKMSKYSKGSFDVNFEGENGVLDEGDFSGNINKGYATTLGNNNMFMGDVSIGWCK